LIVYLTLKPSFHPVRYDCGKLESSYSVLWELLGVSGSLGRGIKLIGVSLASCLWEFFLLSSYVFLLVFLFHIINTCFQLPCTKLYGTRITSTGTISSCNSIGVS